MAGLSLSLWNHDPEAFETFDRWLMEEIRTSVNGQGGIPRMVFGDKWLIPETDDPDDLVRLVESLIRPQSND